MSPPIPKDSHPCFFYGSLMAPAVLNSVTRPGIDSNLCRVNAVIEGFVRHPYHNEPYPGMIASADSTKTVEGILVFGHSAIDVFRLDQFEGSEYTRELLPVKILESVPASFSHGQQPLEAGTSVLSNVYVFTGPVKHLDQTREWDFEAFKNEKLARWMQTSSDFVTDGSEA